MSYFSGFSAPPGTTLFCTLVEMGKGRFQQMITPTFHQIDLVGCVKMWIRVEARVYAPTAWVFAVH